MAGTPTHSYGRAPSDVAADVGADEAAEADQADQTVEVAEIVRAENRHQAATVDALDAPAAPSADAGRTFRGSWCARNPSPRTAVTLSTALVAFGMLSVWLPIVGQWLPATATVAVRVLALLLGLWSLRWSPRRGSGVAVVLVVFAAAWWLTGPFWTAWAPMTRLVHRESLLVTGNLLVALACTFLAGGRRFGVVALRHMWLTVLVTTLPIGVWEVLTGHHLVAGGTWRFPAHSPAAIFGNPNNFAVVLTVGIGLLLGAATERRPSWWRAVLIGLAGVAGWVLWFTTSRGAILSTCVLAGAALVLRLTRGRSGLRRRARAHPRLVAGAAVAAVTAAVATFIVPGLAGINPLLRVVAPSDPMTVRSDTMRVYLVATGLGYWRESPWFGIGIGRFDRLVAEEHPEFGAITSMHNGLAEMLVEFDLVVAIPLGASLVLLMWRIIAAPARGPAACGRPRTIDRVGARYALLVFLLAFLQAGVVVSSSVPWSVWWMLLASATATAWWISAGREAGTEAVEGGGATAGGADGRGARSRGETALRRTRRT